jgi:hypothetical protein
VPETAELFGISYPQVARWANGQHLPFKADDPRNPWHPDRVPIDTTRGPRRRRIAVDRINPAYIKTDAQRSRLAHILARLPDGWSEADCTAQLVLPDPLGPDNAAQLPEAA